MMKWLGTLGAAALLALAAGCSGGGGAMPATSEPPASVAERPTAEPESKAPVETPAKPAESEAAPKPESTAPAKDKNNISVASPQAETIETDVPDDLYMNEDDREAMKTAEEARQEFNRRNYDVTGTFDPLHPTLMGIGIGTNADVVTQRFGEPTEKYLLPDEKEDAAVYSYPGFTIGIRDKKVLFVEVSTRSVSPGLNGLRLGDAKDDAIAKLGKPASETEFVVSYIADGAVLKLDLEPETNKIHSIKLFPEE
ncbi:hypothetical protein [Paenibacillus antri]|nr:hypothetical protein [Paenibacillus antri]